MKKTQKKLALFNVWGLIFGPFYYGWLGMGGKFLLYLFMLPVIYFILGMLAGLADSEPISPVFSHILLLTALIIVHVICSVHVNKDNAIYRKKMLPIEKLRDVPPFPFYSVSVGKLAILLTFSFGLYGLYWLYKNWKIVSQKTKEGIWPIFRSWILHIFFIYPFYLRVKQNFKKRNMPTGTFMFLAVTGTWLYLLYYGLSALNIVQASFLAIIYNVGAYFTGLRMAPVTNTMSVIFFAMISLFFISVIILCIIQYKINIYNKKFKITPQRGISWGEVVTVLVGIILNAAICFFSYAQVKSMLNMPTENRPNTTMLAAGLIYRHSIGYSKVCDELGYQLKNYPQNFRRILSKDIKAIEEKLANSNTSLDQLYLNLEQGVYPALRQSVLEEFALIHQQVTLALLSEKMGVEPEEIVWIDEYWDILPETFACEYIDTDVEINSNVLKPFIN
ncbi:MAG: hypothetical protein LBU87_06205 [Lactobacillales bacterium]|jgi:hypothetical protein|nr:hypothetical protein [Lactobacillales bacterium]